MMVVVMATGAVQNLGTQTQLLTILFHLDTRYRLLKITGQSA